MGACRALHRSAKRRTESKDATSKISTFSQVNVHLTSRSSATCILKIEGVVRLFGHPIRPLPAPAWMSASISAQFALSSSKFCRCVPEEPAQGGACMGGDHCPRLSPFVLGGHCLLDCKLLASIWKGCFPDYPVTISFPVFLGLLLCALLHYLLNGITFKMSWHVHMPTPTVSRRFQTTVHAHKCHPAPAHAPVQTTPLLHTPLPSIYEPVSVSMKLS
jgi:hypothetical protein